MVWHFIVFRIFLLFICTFLWKIMKASTPSFWTLSFRFAIWWWIECSLWLKSLVFYFSWNPEVAGECLDKRNIFVKKSISLSFGFLDSFSALFVYQSVCLFLVFVLCWLVVLSFRETGSINVICVTSCTEVKLMLYNVDTWRVAFCSIF